MAISRWQFIKAALMTHTSAAYLFILSVLGALEQTRDLIISDAKQVQWHIDKVRLPLWFWIIAILMVVLWRLVDHSHRQINQQDNKISQLQARLSPKLGVNAGVHKTLSPTEISVLDANSGKIVKAPGPKSLWIQIQLESLTDVPIEECGGYLSSVRRWNETKKRWEATGFDETLSLGWSLAEGQGSFITIPPRVKKRLNIFTIYETDTKIVPCIPFTPLRAQNVFDDRAAIFRFDIVLAMKDCTSQEVSVEAKLGDKWDEPLVAIVHDSAMPPVVCTASSVKK